MKGMGKKLRTDETRLPAKFLQKNFIVSNQFISIVQYGNAIQFFEIGLS
jgi:hypothetical protein